MGIATIAAMNRLKEPFAADEVEWRIGSQGDWQGKIWVTVFCYVTARAIQDRMDEVFQGNWSDNYMPITIGAHAGVSCELTAVLPEEEMHFSHQGWSDLTDIQAVKGGESSALKRAAVKFGIGRYLYRLGSPYLPSTHISMGKKPNPWKRQAIKGKKNEYFWWMPPELPEWALPASAGEKPRVPDNTDPASPVGSTDPVGSTEPVVADKDFANSFITRCAERCSEVKNAKEALKLAQDYRGSFGREGVTNELYLEGAKRISKFFVAADVAPDVIKRMDNYMHEGTGLQPVA